MHSTTPAVADSPDPLLAAARTPHRAPPAAYPVVRIASIHGVDDTLPVLGLLRATDWTRHALSMDDPWHQELAAQAVAHGAIAFHQLGNVFMLIARPDLAIVRYVNAVTEVGAGQPGSVVTTASHLRSLFDWWKLPAGLDREQVLEFVDSLLELGPIALRGPACRRLPGHLTVATEAGGRSVEVITPCHRCGSNALLERIFVRIPEDYVFGAWADRPPSAGEAAAPFLMLREGDSSSNRFGCALHKQTAVSLLSIHVEFPQLTLARHGSVSAKDIRRVAQRFGLNVVADKPPVRPHFGWTRHCVARLFPVGSRLRAGRGGRV
jgi:hypothetical protein